MFALDIFADPYYQVIYVAEIIGMTFGIIVLASMDSFVPFFITNVVCQYRILRVCNYYTRDSISTNICEVRRDYFESKIYYVGLKYNFLCKSMHIEHDNMKLQTLQNFILKYKIIVPNQHNRRYLLRIAKSYE